MRFAKKSVMVPEDEYMALLNMLRQGDYMKNEKSLIEGKIQQNLEDPRISQTIKSRRHDWLYKKRRQIKKMEENRPQKVTIENLDAVSNLAPYLGVKKSAAKIEAKEVEASPRSIKKVKTKSLRKKQNGENSNKDIDSSNVYLSSSSAKISSDSDEEFKTPPKKPKILFKSTQKTLPKNMNAIAEIISKNPEKYGVTKEGQILNNKGQTIKESNLLESLKYISGQVPTPPRGYIFFMQKINKDPEIAKFFSTEYSQSGEGKRNKRKRVLVKVMPIKTPGLKRLPSKKFKPVIWAKL